MDEQRSLTDADVKALSDELERRFIGHFYSNLGRGVWGIAWKTIVAIVLFLVAYGAAKGIK